MKRLKMPKIPTRIPVPDMPNIRIRSPKKAEDDSVTDAIPPVAAEPAQEAQPVEPPVETKETGHRKVNMPKIPLPGISLPSKAKKASQQEETTPSEIETAPAFQAEEIASPPDKPKAKGISGIHMPSFRKAKEKPIADAEPSPTLQMEKAPAQPKTPKAKVKLSMPRMPKVGISSRSAGKGGTKATGKRILALSIEGNDIRMLSYYNKAVESWKSVPFDASFLKMGQVADPIGLGEALKSAVEGIETHKIYAY